MSSSARAWVYGGALVGTGLLLALFLTLPERIPAEFPKFSPVETELSSGPVATPSKNYPYQTAGVTQPAGGFLPAPSVVVSPAPEAQWVLAEPHMLQWSTPVGRNGGIYLMDAATRDLVGWITPALGPEQASYAWDTRSVSVSRSDPSRKDVQPGRYLIRMEFDRKPPLFLESGPFSIVYAEQVVRKTYRVELVNSVASPAALTLERGERILFANGDPVAHILVPAFNGESKTLKPGEYATLDTKAMAPGTYEYYSKDSPTLRFSLTVKCASCPPHSP